MDVSGNSTVVENIAKGALKKKTVIIKYRDKKGDVSQRETEPYELRDGAYYGYCLNKKEIRRFTLINILSATVTNNGYVARWAIKI